MKDEHRAKLERLLNDHDERQQGEDAQKARKEQVETEALARFDTKCEGVIRPAMEEIAVLLKAKGHHAYIRKCAEGEPDPRGKPQAAHIQIRMDLTGEGLSGYGAPCLTVIFDKTSDQVSFHESRASSRGGYIGSGGEVALEAVTADAVQERLIAFLEEIL